MEEGRGRRGGRRQQCGRHRRGGGHCLPPHLPYSWHPARRLLVEEYFEPREKEVWDEAAGVPLWDVWGQLLVSEKDQRESASLRESGECASAA